MNLAAFPPGAAFLPAFAQTWLAGAAGDGAAGDGAAGEGLIILPNRRAARALAGAFLQANDGRALLLPRIIAPGALDEAGLALGHALALPPAIAPLQRQAILTRLILARNGAKGAPVRLPAAWALAADLAALLDEADGAEIDLAATLPNLVAADLATHWQITLEFLDIVTRAWPAILAETGAVNPAARQTALIDAQIAAWAKTPPTHRVWLVTADAAPATARLAAAIARLPAGRVILHGYDPGLPDDAWEALDDTHNQSGIARLTAAIGARRGDIVLLPAAAAAPPGRAKLLSNALLPAACLSAWQNTPPPGITGLFRLTPPDEQTEATAIAMALRQALETPRASCALVTPDRGLAQRVAAALKRFGITADDSAGEPLAETPPAVLLRLLARAVVAEFAPVPLLALLKHPLAAGGVPPDIFRDSARRLERAALRGPRPSPGFSGIRFRLDKPHHRASADFLTRLELLLAPLILPATINPATALRQLILTAEALAATAEHPGAAALWSGEAGTALSSQLADAMAALETLPDMPSAALSDLLDALLAGPVVRRPRTKDGHPRIAIWGVQEAALQSVDVVILAGLNEGVWPAAADPGPWASRPMRKAAGLPSPEQKIGAAAADFFTLAASCPTVILSAATRRDRAPAVPARWLTRLDAFLAGAGVTLPEHPAAAWVAQLDQPATRIQREKPAPRPPAASRPTELSISDIATLIADPYAIYAKKILKIRELDALDEETDASLFGNIVHEGLEKFFAATPDFFAATAEAALDNALQTALRAYRPRAGLENWWSARLTRIAGWTIAAERARRLTNPPQALKLEIAAQLALPGGFILNGRADRIERRADGTVCIVDYKTGTPPDPKKIQSGAAPQLPLEAVMAEAGAFGPDFCAPVTELAFWKLSGRAEPGAEKPLFETKPADLRAVIDQAAAALPDLFASFARPETPYLAKPHPGRSTFADTYAGISRRAEWGGAGESE
jgi:ATP-dependent helicase/nuclease subunit B